MKNLKSGIWALLFAGMAQVGTQIQTQQEQIYTPQTPIQRVNVTDEEALKGVLSAYINLLESSETEIEQKEAIERIIADINTILKEKRVPEHELMLFALVWQLYFTSEDLTLLEETKELINRTIYSIESGELLPKAEEAGSDYKAAVFNELMEYLRLSPALRAKLSITFIPYEDKLKAQEEALEQRITAFVTVIARNLYRLNDKELTDVIEQALDKFKDGDYFDSEQVHSALGTALLLLKKKAPSIKSRPFFQQLKKRARKGMNWPHYLNFLILDMAW